MRNVGPFGRALRILLGAVLIAAVAPVYWQVSRDFVVSTLLLSAGLVAAYSGVLIATSQVRLNRWVGLAVAVSLVIGVYLTGQPGGILFGGGEGELAALSFVGVSLLLAGVFAVPGCEVMVIPELLFRRRSHLPCLLLSPVDRLETRLSRPSAP